MFFLSLGKLWAGNGVSVPPSSDGRKVCPIWVIVVL